jgi:ATP-binding cassette subfamily B protein
MALLKNYTGWIVLLIVLALLSNSLNLVIPKIIANGIDAFTSGSLNLKKVIWEFCLVSGGIFILFYLQSIVQTYTSEKVARDLRHRLTEQISRLNFANIQEYTPAKLLTNLTADIDSIKMFVAMAIVSIVSSIFVIIGVSVLLILIDWQLALAVLTIIPIIGGTFFVVFGQIRQLFLRAREVLDWLNKVINESILGSAIIRVLNSQQTEYNKFLAANTEAQTLGMQILKLFATMIPIISFVSNLAMLIILALGGHYVITNHLSLGNFTAFVSYVSILVFPILIIGFMSNIIAQATASYDRIALVLDRPVKADSGTIKDKLTGNIELNNVSVTYGDKTVLKDVTFKVTAGSKTAIVGPTAAGKTQLLYLLTGLIIPQSGTIKYDGHLIFEYDQVTLHRQIGLVFQDSILFNLTMRENLSFGDVVTPESLTRAINTAELDEFVDLLPEGLETIISERGTSLSGGQKQRIMLARALALNPKVLLLDDFTARVDSQTEGQILKNIQKNYPNITLISVTQKISSIEHYDQIILLMEGDVLAKGTHDELLNTSPEYAQIYKSQQSTNSYELQS